MQNTAYASNYPFLYRGIVESNIDPENLGRCRVRIPFIHGELTYSPEYLPWARPITTSPIGNNRGSVNIPDIGDIVWVLFEGSDKKFPVYIGGTYGSGEIKADPNQVIFYTNGEIQLSYNKITKSFFLSVGSSHIEITGEGITYDHEKAHISYENSRESFSLSVGDSAVEVSEENISIRGNVKIDGNLEILGATTMHK